MHLNLDKYVLPDIDSNVNVPSGEYELMGAICIEGRKITKFEYYTLIHKKLRKSKQKKWFKFNPDDYVIENMGDLTTDHYP